MSKKLYWGFAPLILLIIGAFVFLIVKNQAEIRQLEREAAAVQKQLQQQNAQQVPQGEPSAQGHFHDDGTFHEGAPENPIETEPSQASQVSRDFTPAQVKIPEEITDPDVLAAWKRVDYIANNIWEWGGTPSPRFMGLRDQLMPPPSGFSGPSGHSDAEDTIYLLGELVGNGDPRAAEVFVAYFCGGIIGGRGPIIGLARIGPPAVPLLIPYLFDDTVDPELLNRPVEALGEICVKYREDLEGIVEHIIIPKFEEYAAIEDPSPGMFETQYCAKEALANLK